MGKRLRVAALRHNVEQANVKPTAHDRSGHMRHAILSRKAVGQSFKRTSLKTSLV
jgi:hypothetical protein